MSKKLTRRDFVRASVMAASGAILAACAAPTPETVRVIETQIVEKEGKMVVQTVEVVKK